MVYMGGKQKLIKYICPIINTYIKENGITDFYDVMCGGANIVVNIECENLYANDLSPTLIALLQQAQKNFEEIEYNSAREEWDLCYAEYKRLKKNNFKDIPEIPLARIGTIEWLGSYCGRGFPGGYGVKSEGRDLYNERYCNLKAQSEQTNFSKTKFSCGNYFDLTIPENALIYSDGPYYLTKAYGINKDFDYEKYYSWLREKSKTNPIFISEQTMPEDFKEVWRKEVKRTLHKDVEGKRTTEKLFFIDNR